MAGKGGKNRSRAKSDRDGKRELHFKNVDEGQEYAQVLKMHGGPWLEAYCFDGVKRMCHICGKMGRKVRIAVGDIVLISLRGFQVRRRDKHTCIAGQRARCHSFTITNSHTASVMGVGVAVDSMQFEFPRHITPDCFCGWQFFQIVS